MLDNNGIIYGLASGVGGAISIIRYSGENCVSLSSSIFSIDLTKHKNNRVIKTNVIKGSKIIDECLVCWFKKDKSFTGEETVEIYCHSSNFITTKIFELFENLNFKVAEPGEFTKRALVNGKIDLLQAEAINDLIKSDNSFSHSVALKQLKGNLSNELKKKRKELIKISSLIELELDFSEEDVEFVSKQKVKNIIEKTINDFEKLIDTYKSGNAFKNGYSIAIIGKTNSGKSTLLNTLLEENKAIVSDIEGTTRDTIDGILFIDGIKFRIIDTAGIRKTKNKIEKIGIQKSLNTIVDSDIVLYIYDGLLSNLYDEKKYFNKISNDKQNVIFIKNKIDKENKSLIEDKTSKEYVSISAKNKININLLKKAISNRFKKDNNSNINNLVINNQRQLNCLSSCVYSLKKVVFNIENEIYQDMIAYDFSEAIKEIGKITGEIINDEILDSIFNDFCIGK